MLSWIVFSVIVFLNRGEVHRQKTALEEPMPFSGPEHRGAPLVHLFGDVFLAGCKTSTWPEMS
jgi:hypothetical protein